MSVKREIIIVEHIPVKVSDSTQLFHTFLCNSQNYHPRGVVKD